MGSCLDGRARGAARRRGRAPRRARRTSPATRPSTAPIPDDLHPKVARGARAPRHHVAVLPPGRGLGQRDARRRHDRHDRHRERQVAVLQPARAARARRRPARARALPLPDQGARAGPGAQPRRSCGSPRCATRSTTATRPRRSAPRSAAARTWCSPIRTCCTSASCPTTPAGATSSPTWRWWSSTRRTSTAACSARTSANVLRRLRRLADAYGTRPRFVLTSATIANPLSAGAAS